MNEKESSSDAGSSVAQQALEQQNEHPLSKEPVGPRGGPQAIEYPGLAKLLVTMLALYLAMFLVAMDKTILSTAIPRITDEFNSLSDIGWYGSSYMLTLCCFQLLWGRIYTFHSPKTVFLVCIFIFEVGSALCGAAPSSTSFIIGRAIAGAGSSGITSGAIVIVMHTVPLEKRPVFQGMIGMVFGVASVVGPLLGGVFTQHVSWRWCFYINLPCGAISSALIILILKLPSRKEPRLPLLEQLKKLDPLGTVLFLPSVICLLLALQWGGTTYAWSSARIIALLVLFSVLCLAFLASQIYRPDVAQLPMRIVTQRTIYMGLIFTSTSQAAMYILTYYIPIYFQALRNYAPLESGLALLPTILALVIGSIGAGAMVQRIGYPAPFMIASAILTSIGAGLVTTWQINAGRGMWIGYQVLFGIGIGIGMQQPSMSAQIVLPRPDVPTGISLMFFGQNLGGSIFLSVAENIFTDTLAEKLAAIPGVDVTKQMVVNLGATQIRDLFGKELLPRVLDSYSVAVRDAFYVGVALAGISVIGAVGVEWVSVKKGEKVDTAPKGKGMGQTEDASAKETV